MNHSILMTKMTDDRWSVLYSTAQVIDDLVWAALDYLVRRYRSTDTRAADRTSLVHTRQRWVSKPGKARGRVGASPHRLHDRFREWDKAMQKSDRLYLAICFSCLEHLGIDISRTATRCWSMCTQRSLLPGATRQAHISELRLEDVEF